MPAKILYNFATRSRPAKCVSSLENISQLVRHPNYQIIVTADLDDPTMCNDKMRDKVNSYPNAKIYYGNSTGKVDAINKNVALADEDVTIIVNMSDDFVFLQEGFDVQIVSDMNKYFPDNTGFLHYPDGSIARDVLCTMSIIGIAYYRIFNYIYHPDYKSVSCDNEAIAVAKILKKHKYIDNQIFEHRHPAWGKAPSDELYKRNEEKVLYATDGETFRRRKKQNFGL